MGLHGKKLNRHYPIGTKYFFLTVVSDTFYKQGKKQRIPYIKCECICGKVKDIKLFAFYNQIKSCGCKRLAILAKTQFQRKGSLANDGYKVCARCLLSKTVTESSHWIWYIQILCCRSLSYHWKNKRIIML
jgi:hypothetical protein